MVLGFGTAWQGLWGLRVDLGQHPRARHVCALSAPQVCAPGLFLVQWEVCLHTSLKCFKWVHSYSVAGKCKSGTFPGLVSAAGLFG